MPYLVVLTIDLASQTKPRRSTPGGRIFCGARCVYPLRLSMVDQDFAPGSISGSGSFGWLGAAMFSVRRREGREGGGVVPRENTTATIYYFGRGERGIAARVCGWRQSVRVAMGPCSGVMSGRCIFVFRWECAVGCPTSVYRLGVGESCCWGVLVESYLQQKQGHRSWVEISVRRDSHHTVRVRTRCFMDPSLP